MRARAIARKRSKMERFERAETERIKADRRSEAEAAARMEAERRDAAEDARITAHAA